LKSEPNDPVWVQKAKRNEERNEKMNLMNSAQKSNSRAFDEGYDGIRWGKPTPSLEWYAYRHATGTLHLKRYFSELQQGDIDEAIESDFVVKVVGPFSADNRDEAIQEARRLLNG